jgi:hypothetical protein
VDSVDPEPDRQHSTKLLKALRNMGLDPGSEIRKKLNSDPGFKKAPDPGSATLRSTLSRIFFPQTGLFVHGFSLFFIKR